MKEDHSLYNYKIFYTSAKTGDGIENMFKYMAK